MTLTNCDRILPACGAPRFRRRLETAIRRLAGACLAPLLFLQATGGLQEVSLEDLPHPPGGTWNGSDRSGGFRSGWARFENFFNTDYASWSGFSYSSITDTNSAGWQNQYAVWMPGTGAAGSKTYAVGFDAAYEEHDIISFALPVSVRGLFVNNTTYTALTIRDGDTFGFTRAFGGESGNEPDWFKLVITGRDPAGLETGSVEFYLADYRFADNSLDYIVSDWSWVDLAPLGSNVLSLHFRLSSSDTGDWGMNTPAYFAVDDIRVSPSFQGVTAGFDELSLPAGTYRSGANLPHGFESGFVAFPASYDTETGNWTGFALSSVNDTTTAGPTNLHAVWSPGTDAGGNGNYAVVADDSDDIHDVIRFHSPVYVDGFFVNNTTYSALSMRDGHPQGPGKKFGGDSGNDADWFRLTIRGRNAGGEDLGQVRVMLADYRFADNAQDYILGEWKWVDLQSLGPGVSSLHFSLDSSDSGPSGINPPPFFALDDLRFTYSFSSFSGDAHPLDAPVAGFTGPGGAGSTIGSNQVVNPAFAGWAATVAGYSPAGQVAEPWRTATNALGAVSGNEAAVVSLGDLSADMITAGSLPGTLTLEMSVPISDEAGPDFAVFENAFASGAGTFGELGFIDVSSDGIFFLRFPAVSLTPSPVGPFEPFRSQLVYNLCGKHANGYGRSWGTPFDLGELAAHDAVQSNLVDLANIRFVRIVDIPGSGDAHDAYLPPNPVYDPWMTLLSGGADIDAVGVINSPDYHRITTAIQGTGTIRPRGMPNGLVSVRAGGQQTFTIASNPDQVVLDIIVDGHSIGITNRVTFDNVTQDHHLEVRFGSRLIVRSQYGTPYPAAGQHFLDGALSAYQAVPAVTVGATQYVCTGWVGTGSIPALGSTAATGPLSITNASSITWTWMTNVWLDAQSGYGGTVSGDGNGWYAYGSAITATALADPWFAFAGWSGTVAADTNAPVLSMTLNAPAEIRAHFYAETGTNGVPLAWLNHHELTNGAVDLVLLEDEDHDGLATWQEFYAGTDPGSSASVFMILETGMLNGSNFVCWLGGTNGSAQPFQLMRYDAPDAESPVGMTRVPRNPSGTNMLWLPAEANRSFYRVGVEVGP